MTDHHPHMPPVKPPTARWSRNGEVVLVIDGHEIPVRGDDALNLALAIADVLQLERW